MQSAARAEGWKYSESELGKHLGKKAPVVLVSTDYGGSWSKCRAIKMNSAAESRAIAHQRKLLECALTTAESNGVTLVGKGGEFEDQIEGPGVRVEL